MIYIVLSIFWFINISDNYASIRSSRSTDFSHILAPKMTFTIFCSKEFRKGARNSYFSNDCSKMFVFVLEE